MSNSSTTGVGITEEGETYEPLHVHSYYHGDVYSGTTQTAASKGGDNQYHAHAFDKESSYTRKTEDHIHQLGYFVGDIYVPPDSQKETDG